MLIDTHDTAWGQKQIKVMIITDFFKTSDSIHVASNNSFHLDKTAEEKWQKTQSQGGLINQKLL